MQIIQFWLTLRDPIAVPIDTDIACGTAPWQVELAEDDDLQPIGFSPRVREFRVQ
ncbi:MAG: hypothetical protein ACLQDY_28315 [Streptosporangiaceae bacterium]